MSVKKHGRFPAIGSLAVIGDGRSVALLEPEGAVVWYCPARFDSPPLLWRLLDDQQGGYLRIAPPDLLDSLMRYQEDTAILEYEWITPTGKARAQVCMEWPVKGDQQHLLWLVSGISGEVIIDADLKAQPDLSPKRPMLTQAPEGFLIENDNYRWLFQSDISLQEAQGQLSGKATLCAGETMAFCFTSGSKSGKNTPAVKLPSVRGRIENTRHAWRDWIALIQWPQSSYREAVIRSAITLKLLIYEPTGAVVAAGTLGLPEVKGGVRNWDYRYTWFRDAGLTLDALFSLGCHQEAHQWADWMQNTVMRQDMPLQVLYDIDGMAPPPEEKQPHICGYEESYPVRTGNAADGQFQLDIYGELLECVVICDQMQDDARRSHWDHLRLAADFIAENWTQPDKGIWEVRSGQRHFVHSKVAAWAGLQRALWLQEKHSLEGDSENWRRQAAAIKAEVMRRGISKDGTHFVRAFDGPDVDASLLLLPRYGFIEATDDRFQNTLDVIQTTLGVGDRENGLLRRYAGSDADGLPGEEGAFVICSFWLVDALIRCQRHAEAERIFHNLLAMQGQCGLYAEEINPKTKEHLGNFPQAFSHVGLINAALLLKAPM